MKRIQHDLDLVIVENVLPPRHARPHFLRIVEANEHDVEIFPVVAEIGCRLLRNFFSIVWVALHKARHLRHLQRNLALRLHPEEVF